MKSNIFADLKFVNFKRNKRALGYFAFINEIYIRIVYVRWILITRQLVSYITWVLSDFQEVKYRNVFLVVDLLISIMSVNNI